MLPESLIPALREQLEPAMVLFEVDRAQNAPSVMLGCSTPPATPAVVLLEQLARSCCLQDVPAPPYRLDQTGFETCCLIDRQRVPMLLVRHGNVLYVSQNDASDRLCNLFIDPAAGTGDISLSVDLSHP